MELEKGVRVDVVGEYEIYFYPSPYSVQVTVRCVDCDVLFNEIVNAQHETATSTCPVCSKEIMFKTKGGAVCK